MVYIYFANKFESDNVIVEYGSKPDELNSQIALSKFETISRKFEPGIHYYRYKVDGENTINTEGLVFIAPTPVNYFIVNSDGIISSTSLFDVNMIFSIAIYYFIRQKYNEYIKYMTLAVEKDHCIAMVNLGHYYHHISKNEAEMKRFYLMAINKGYTDAMLRLASYYKEIKDHNSMFEYYTMAIERGSVKALFEVGYFYQCESNFDKMKEFYQRAIEKGNTSAIAGMIKYYTVTAPDIEQKTYYNNMYKTLTA